MIGALLRLPALWILAAIGIVAALLWWILQPADISVEPPLPIASVTTSLPQKGAIDLAVSSALFFEDDQANTALGLVNGTDPTQVAGAAATTSPPRLVGVALRGRTRAVALLVGSSGETKIVRNGEMVDQWSVLGIGRDHVVVSDGTRRETLALNLANKTGSAPAISGTAAPAPVSINPGIRGNTP